MAKKGKFQRTPAEEYLSHLHWQSMSRGGYRRWPWWTEPEWNYKIITKKGKDASPVVPIILLVGMFIFLAITLGETIFLERSNLAIFAVIVVVLIFTILFLAVKDAEKSDDESSQEDE